MISHDYLYYNICMTTYRKREVINVGKKRIRKIRSILIPFSCLLAPASIVLLVLYFVEYPTNQSLVSAGVVLLCLAVGFIIGAIFTNDPLKEGTIHIRNLINQYFRDENSKVKDKIMTPKFRAEELYTLLIKNVEVEYYDIREYDVTPLGMTATNKNYESTSSEEDRDIYDEIDDYLSGKIEYDDMSEDAKIVYEEELEDEEME